MSAPAPFARNLISLAFMLIGAMPAAAVPVTPGGPVVVLPGTTLAARPELAGTMIEDSLTAWESAIDPLYGFPGAEGMLQSRVVRETLTGTLDFYWRLTVSQTSYPASTPDQLDLSGLVLANFLTGASFDADYRLDGVGFSAPTGAYAADADSFSFVMNHTSLGPNTTTYFLMLHSNATTYDQSAVIRAGVTSIATFAPTAPVPEPQTWLLLCGGLGLLGLASSRRSTRHP